MGKKRFISLPLLALYWSASAPSRLLAAEKTAVLFEDLCSVCHGVGGKGYGQVRRGLSQAGGFYQLQGYGQGF
jgi:mono/diheme cytochrome c family protein